MRKLTAKLVGAIYLVESKYPDPNEKLTIETYPNGRYLVIQHTKRERIIIEFAELDDLIKTLQEIKNETTDTHI